jgi:hypothetical protein
MLSEQDRRRFNQEGYLRMPQVFSTSEIDRFRAGAARLHKGAVEARYIYEIPELQDLWRHPRLVGIAGDILGTPLTYFFSGHIHRYDFSQGDNDTARHLHHDAKGTVQNIHNRVNEQSDTPYPILRFAIYLQDTETQSGGLKIAAGSHLRDVSHFKQSDFALHNVASQPGDVIAFTHRILHSPLGLRFRDGRAQVLTPQEEDTLLNAQPELFLPIPQIRQTLFIDYARAAETADLYIKNRAVTSAEPNDLLSKLLVDGDFVARNRDCGMAFRVDRAIVETVDNTARHIIDGRLDEAGITHLARLPTLCRMHTEGSPHHLIHTGDVQDTSLQTALRLYGEIAPRIVGLRRQKAARTLDLHMASLPYPKRVQKAI